MSNRKRSDLVQIQTLHRYVETKQELFRTDLRCLLVHCESPKWPPVPGGRRPFGAGQNG